MKKFSLWWGSWWILSFRLLIRGRWLDTNISMEQEGRWACCRTWVLRLSFLWRMASVADSASMALQFFWRSSWAVSKRHYVQFQCPLLSATPLHNNSSHAHPLYTTFILLTVRTVYACGSQHFSQHPLSHLRIIITSVFPFSQEDMDFTTRVANIQSWKHLTFWGYLYCIYLVIDDKTWQKKTFSFVIRRHECKHF